LRRAHEPGGCVSALYNLGRAFFAPEKEQRSKTIEEKFQDVVLDEGRKGAHLIKRFQLKLINKNFNTHLSEIQSIGLDFFKKRACFPPRRSRSADLGVAQLTD